MKDLTKEQVHGIFYHKKENEVVMLKRDRIRYMGYFLAVCLLAAVLAGCGDKSQTETDGEIITLEEGVLKVGMNLASPPMAYVEESTAKPAGFEVELAYAVAEKLGLKLEIIDTTEENLLNSLDADIYDCAISMIPVTKWSQKQYASTNPYADISSVQEVLSGNAKGGKIAVFGKKKSPLITAVEKQALEPLKKDGTLSELSGKYFEKNIIVK